MQGTGPETSGNFLKMSKTQIQGANHSIRDMGDIKRLSIKRNFIY